MTRRLALAVPLIFLLAASSAHAAFPGSNGKIAFSRELAPLGSSPVQIFAVDPSGVGPVSLASNANLDFSVPDWSPDGRRIAMGGQNTSTSDTHIYVMNANGSGRRQVTFGSGEISPSWAPDGQSLAFVKDHPTTGYDIWLLKTDNRKAEPFLNTSFREEHPEFSPDGHWIKISTFQKDTSSFLSNSRINSSKNPSNTCRVIFPITNH